MLNDDQIMALCQSAGFDEPQDCLWDLTKKAYRAGVHAALQAYYEAPVGHDPDNAIWALLEEDDDQA